MLYVPQIRCELWKVVFNSSAPDSWNKKQPQIEINTISLIPFSQFRNLIFNFPTTSCSFLNNYIFIIINIIVMVAIFYDCIFYHSFILFMKLWPHGLMGLMLLNVILKYLNFYPKIQRLRLWLFLSARCGTLAVFLFVVFTLHCFVECDVIVNCKWGSSLNNLWDKSRLSCYDILCFVMLRYSMLCYVM